MGRKRSFSSAFGNSATSFMKRRRWSTGGISSALGAALGLAAMAGRRNSRSHTKTKTKKKTDTGNGESSGEFNRIQYIGSKGKGRKFKKFKKRVDAVLDSEQPYGHFTAQYTRKLSAVVGQQGAEMFQIKNVADLRSTAQTIVPGVDNYRVVLESVVLNGFITNHETAVVIVDLYHCVARQDNQNGTTPLALWQEFVSVTSASSSAPTTATFGITPFAVPQFGKFYKIKSKRRMMLAPGVTKQIQERRKSRKVITANEYIDIHGSRNEDYKGVTEYWLMIAYGGPIQKHNNITTVSTAPVNCSLTFNVDYKMRNTANTTSTSTGGFTMKNFNGLGDFTTGVPETVLEFNPQQIQNPLAND